VTVQIGQLLPQPWDLYGSQPTQRTSRSVSPNQEHPTEWPLLTDELAELLLRNSRPSYKGYRLFLTIPQPDGTEQVYAHPSGNKLSLRFDGREKLKPWFKLRPFGMHPSEGVLCQRRGPGRITGASAGP